MKKRTRLIISIAIILLTIAEFSYYLSRHTDLLKQLGHTPALVIVWILLLYTAIFGILFLILHASLRICRVVMPYGDNLLLNAYSLFVNFFMIGQAGPGVRAAYLRKHYKLQIRKYIYVTLLYYACYAIVSSMLVLVGSAVLPWWLTLLAIVLVIGGCALVVRLYNYRTKGTNEGLQLSFTNLFYLFAVTLLQAAVQVIIYLTELHSVNAHISFGQAVTYTGVANFALFVGLTPGAIGIRETFLVFSERLHHISSANIVSANVIDRSVYLLFLGILFVIILSFHAKKRFTLSDTSGAIKHEK